MRKPTGLIALAYGISLSITATTTPGPDTVMSLVGGALVGFGAVMVGKEGRA